MEIIQSTASGVLINLVLGVITLLGAYGLYYIQKATAKAKTQIAQIKDESSRKLLTNALEDVSELASVTVGSLEQTTASTLRKAVKEGKADREELLALGKQAFNDVKAAVSPKAQKVITENLGSFDTYLQNLIEDAVRRVKQEEPYITVEGTANTDKPATGETSQNADTAAEPEAETPSSGN